MENEEKEKEEKKVKELYWVFRSQGAGKLTFVQNKDGDVFPFMTKNFEKISEAVDNYKI